MAHQPLGRINRDALWWKSHHMQRRNKERRNAGPSYEAIVNTVAPVISGTAEPTNELSSTTGTWTNDPSAGALSYSYQWKRDGASISGATSSTYTVQEADVGTTLTCTVTATDLSGSESATSNSLAADYAALTNTVAPALSGTAEVGNTLTCSTGTWTNDPTAGAITYAYQWQRDGVNISGETTNSYTLVSADAETNIKCVVTATDESGSVSADSNAESIPAEATDPSRTFLGSAPSSSSTVHTFSGGSLGTPDPSRYIVVYVAGAVLDHNITSVTIGGVAASEIISGDLDGLWGAAVPDGSTGDIVIELSSADEITMGVYALYYLNSTTPIDTVEVNTESSSPLAATLTCQEGGIAIFGATGQDGQGQSSPSFFTWTGDVFGDYDVFIPSGGVLASAGSQENTGTSCSVTAGVDDGDNVVLAGASFR